MIIKQNSIVPFANVAQSVEQLIRNQQVMGSSPIISSKLRFCRSFFICQNRFSNKNEPQTTYSRRFLRAILLYNIQNGNATGNTKKSEQKNTAGCARIQYSFRQPSFTKKKQKTRRSISKKRKIADELLRQRFFIEHGK